MSPTVGAVPSTPRCAEGAKWLPLEGKAFMGPPLVADGQGEPLPYKA